MLAGKIPIQNSKRIDQNVETVCENAAFQAWVFYKWKYNKIRLFPKSSLKFQRPFTECCCVLKGIASVGATLKNACHNEPSLTVFLRTCKIDKLFLLSRYKNLLVKLNPEGFRVIEKLQFAFGFVGFGVLMLI